ncbi:MAG: hypothetical protein JWM82_4178 [Myxococcales bacterium]|nr:hypothetical protein [Myxococcales bacterium]
MMHVWHVTLGALLAASPGAPDAASPTQVVPFRTELRPRVDPVFGDAASLRASVDRFFALQGEMEHVRDEFSTAVHETLAALADVTPPSAKLATKPQTKAQAKPETKPDARSCPATTTAPYGRALAAGAKYLLLGQQLQGRFRDIRRADDLGDVAALTPDYRAKIKKVRELFGNLLADYREMRVAFYDQLGAELRHASCKTATMAKASAGAADAGVNASLDVADVLNPTDASAWSLSLDEVPASDEARAAAPAPAGKRPALVAASDPGASTGAVAAPSIWIDVDNTLCAQPTHVSVDGQPLGDVGARKRAAVRTHAGPREICALPASDARACGAPGTVRKAYLHEGWSLTVHCEP